MKTFFLQFILRCFLATSSKIYFHYFESIFSPFFFGDSFYPFNGLAVTFGPNNPFNRLAVNFGLHTLQNRVTRIPGYIRSTSFLFFFFFFYMRTLNSVRHSLKFCIVLEERTRILSHVENFLLLILKIWIFFLFLL